MISQNINSPRDEELLDSAIAEYLRAESAGQACDRQQWLDRYPACMQAWRSTSTTAIVSIAS